MKKKLENIWYYYKYYILGGLLAIIALLIAVKSCSDKPEYDFTVLYMTHGYVDMSGELETLVEKYADDVNGNGNVDVQLITISYGTTHKESMSAGATRSAQLAAGENILFLLDEQNYKELKEHGFLMDISHLGESSKLADDCFDATEILHTIDGFEKSGGKYYFCIRTYDEDKAAKQKGYDARYEIAYDYIKKLAEQYK